MPVRTVGLKPALIVTFVVQVLGLAAAFVQAGHFTTLTYIQLAAAVVNLGGVIFVGPGQVADGQPGALEPPHPEAGAVPPAPAPPAAATEPVAPPPAAVPPPVQPATPPAPPPPAQQPPSGP